MTIEELKRRVEKLKEDSPEFKRISKAIEVAENKYIKCHNGEWFFVDESDFLRGPYGTKWEAEIALDNHVTNYLPEGDE